MAHGGGGGGGQRVFFQGTNIFHIPTSYIIQFWNPPLNWPKENDTTPQSYGGGGGEGGWVQRLMFKTEN